MQNQRRSIASFVVTVAFAAGCSVHKAPPRLPDQPSTTRLAEEQGPLDVVFQERSAIFYGGVRNIPAEVPKPRVDYQSELRIAIKPTDATVSSALPALSDTDL